MSGLKIRLNLNEDGIYEPVKRHSDDTNNGGRIDYEDDYNDYSEDAQHNFKTDECPTQIKAYACVMTVRGDSLTKITASLKPVLSSLKSTTITFCRDGAIVQGSVCGQKIFIPLVATNFSEYYWSGPSAVFLASTDSRRTLMDAFKGDKSKVPAEIKFTVSGTVPNRSLTQTTTYASDSGTITAVVLKYELWSSNTTYPSTEPDCSFAFSKQQLSKLIATAAKADHENLTFALKPEGGFFVGTIAEVTRFDVDGSKMIDYPYSSGTQQSMTKFLTKTGKMYTCSVQQATQDSSEQQSGEQTSKPANTNFIQQKALIGSGTGKPFCLALEDTDAFRALIQKIRPGSNGIDVSFYLSTETPMMRVRLNTPASPSVYMFCTSDCVPMHELEAVSAVSGSVTKKPTVTKKRAAPSNNKPGKNKPQCEEFGQVPEKRSKRTNEKKQTNKTGVH